MIVFCKASRIAIVMFFSLLALVTTVGHAGELDLRGKSASGVKVLEQPAKTLQETATTLLLPEYEKACFFSPDSPPWRWIGASNRMLPWMADDDLNTIYDGKKQQNPTIPKANRRGIFLLLKLRSGDYMALTPLAGPYSASWLEVTGSGKVIANYSTVSNGKNKLSTKGPIPLISWCRNADIYRACHDVWTQAISTPPIQGRVGQRSQKVYPEPFYYLGWCTWEQYHGNINEKLLLKAIDLMESSGLPIRWMLIDDGHQQDIKRSLLSLQPHKGKFPNGWKPILDRRNPDGVRWIGIWHCLLTLWGNIHHDHKMADLAPFLMPQNPRNEKSSLIPRDDKASSEAFYQTFIKQVKEQGFDFTKVDNMSRATLEYANTPNAARAEWMNVHFMEEACKEHDLPLMNCSAMNSIIMCNTKYSATMRCSIDYRVGQPATAKSHVLQSFANTLWQGQTLWPDHDMFHSSDPSCGELMAVTKAMSGGPVYVSDAPKDFRHDFIRPLCYQDGKLLRPLAPGAPTPESAVLDALNDTSAPYETIAPLANETAAVAAFNLVHPTPKESVGGTITVKHYQNAGGMMQPYEGEWKVPGEGLAVYDWRKQTGKVLSDRKEYAIQGFDYALFLLCPIRQGWAVVGRADKYLGPAAVEKIVVDKNRLQFKLHESGPVVIYSSRGPVHSKQAKFESIGNGFYRADLPVKNESVTLEIYRKGNN